MDRSCCALVALALVFLATPVAEAQACTFGPDGQVQQCNFGSGQSAPATPAPWYADPLFQTGLAVVGLVGSAGAGTFALMRVRARRRTLADLLREVETSYAHSKGDPAAGVPRLIDLRHEVRARYDKGRLEDAQFLELDKRITAYLTKLRIAELDARFADISPMTRSEIRRVISDGTVSDADVALARRLAATASGVSGAALVALVERWAAEDAGAHRLRRTMA
ncbi:MAG: hypothetical protein ACYDCK_02090 [Thermoplasmatota archaeon]